MNPDWFSLSSSRFQNYSWKPNLYLKDPVFLCNGIRIYDALPLTLEKHGFNVPAPFVSIIDPNALLPINLARTKVDQLPQEEDLYKQVFRWYIAKLLITKWETDDDYQNNLKHGFHVSKFTSNQNVPYILHRTGYQLNYVSTIAAMNIQQYAIICTTATNFCETIHFLQNTLCGNKQFSIVPVSNHPYSDFPESPVWTNSFFEKTAHLFSLKNLLYDPSGDWTSIQLKRDIFPQIKSAFKSLLEPYRTEKNSTHIFFSRAGSDDDILWHSFDSEQYPVIINIAPRFHTNADSESPYENKGNYITMYGNTDSIFTRTLCEILTPAPDYSDQSLWIPFDMAERKKKFPKAFEELKVYMDHIRKYPIE